MTDNTIQPRSLRALIADDSYAMSFQSMGQYRTALLAACHTPTTPSAAGQPLTFAEFRHANVHRCLKWHPDGIESWSPSDWLTAITGELGELASLLKMRNRERDGLPGNKFSPTQKQIADEVADVLTYLDLLAEALGVDLANAAVEKFNEVSVRVGFPDRLPTDRAADKGAVTQEDGAQAEPEGQPVRVLRSGNNVVSAAAYDVLAERGRQVGVEGWTTDRDDTYKDGSLARAAAAYALAGSSDGRKVGDELTPSLAERLWPSSWDWKWFKPKDCRRNLVKAGALILADIERLDRDALRTTSTDSKADGNER